MTLWATSCTSHNTSFTYCGAWLSLHLQHIFPLLWGLTQPSPSAHRTSFPYCGAWLSLHMSSTFTSHNTSFPYCGAWLSLHLHIAQHIFPYCGAWLNLHLHIAQHIFPLLWGLTQPSPAHRTTHLSPTVGPDSAFTCTSHNTSFPYCGAWLSLHLHIAQHIFPLLWGLTQPSPAHRTTHLSPTVGPDSAFTCTSHNTSFPYCGAWHSLHLHITQHIFHLLRGLTQPSPAHRTTHLSPTVGPDSAFTCTSHNTSFPYCGAWLSLHLHIAQHIFPLLWGLTQPSPAHHTTHLSPTEGPDTAFTCTSHNTSFPYCGAWHSLHLHIAQHIFHLLRGLTQPSPAHRTTHLSPTEGLDSAFTSHTVHNTSFTYCWVWLSLHLHNTSFTYCGT